MICSESTRAFGHPSDIQPILGTSPFVLITSLMGKPLVYSYTRFSDPRQSTGSSAERQSEYAARWAAEHALELDSRLSLRDEGLSAYHQRHVKQGALGVFLQAVDDGLIPPGSVLIVEGLDRLSRAEPLQAQAQLAQIINAGITVVTASDGREYNRQSLKAQPMDLVYSLLVMIRAHEESDTKSKRVKAAIRRQCEGWLAGTNRAIIRNGKDPAWLRWTGSAWELIPSRVEAVRMTIKLYLDGYGAVRIVRELAERGLSFTENDVTASQIYRSVRLRALVGEKEIEVDGQQYILPGYYPSIVSESDFALLQAATTARTRQMGKGEIPGVVTGIGILHCGYCGQALTGQNNYTRRKADGSFAPGHRRLVCVGYLHNRGCTGEATFSVVPIENAVMDFCTDQINLTSLMSGTDRTPTIAARLATLRTRHTDLVRQIERLTAAMLADDGDTPMAFVRKARELEAQQTEIEGEIRVTEHELASAGRSHAPAAVDAWIAARDGAKALDYDARMTVRRLVSETFSRIVVYQRGSPHRPKNRHMEIVLTGRRGYTRVLRVHRRTGEWTASEDVSPEVS